MRIRTSWFTGMVTVALALAPGAVRAQDYNPPDPQFPLPLYSNRPDVGGPFVGAEFIFWRQTNPLKSQVIAQRGIRDFDGSITSQLNPVNQQLGLPGEPSTVGAPFILLPGPPQPGTFIGSGTPALNANEAQGPQTFQPGYEVFAGWRFRSGLVVEASWLQLNDARYSQVATLALPGLHPDQLLADTFLTSPVFNFPNEFAGPPFKVALGNPFAAYGIWDAASIMEIQFIQRFDQFDMTGRIPLIQDDCNRCYGLVGPRVVNMWERFKWRTVAEDFTGYATPADVALYTNITSQRMYGFHFGAGDEYRLGDTPVGTFAVSLDTQAALFLNVVKEEAKYERSDFYTAAKRVKRDYDLVPELQANLNLWWYPIEGVELRVGYDAMAFFETYSSPHPVDFNYGRTDPGWRSNTFRYFDGINAGIAFIF